MIDSCKIAGLARRRAALEMPSTPWLHLRSAADYAALAERGGMIHKFVHHNDHLSPLEQVRLSPGQAGLLNGWGVFTTLRIYGGRPFAFDRHWHRLTADAERLKIPVQSSPGSVHLYLTQLINANRVKEGCARIYLIFNKVGYWTSDEPIPEVDLILYTADLPSREGPARLALQPHGRYTASPLAGVKVTSWLQNVWMLDQSLHRKFDEVILLNERNEVAECTAANIFCERNNEVVTPPLSSGCLPGVTRTALLELGGTMGLAVRETSLSVQDLYSADEVFISSTTREVQPVSQIEDRQIARVNGPITQRLAKAFSDYVRQSLLKTDPHAANEPILRSSKQ